MPGQNLQTLSDNESVELIAMLGARYKTPLQKQKGARDKLMAVLMLDAGLRVGELIRLRVGDLLIIDVPVESLIVTAEISKSKAERSIPMTERCKWRIKLLNDLVWLPQGYRLSDYAFRGNGLTERITPQQVERIIKRAGFEALHRDIHPHMLRHTFGTRLMRKTNSRIVMQLLGHQNLSSTQIYLHPGQEDLKKAIVGLEPDEKSKAVTL
jgi:site-specific recombinase XerD